jgi:N-acetylglutamate synthase-like GNAT family acetyltransferase
MGTIVRRAGAQELTGLLEFYRRSGYSPEVNPEDAFYIAVNEEAIIGVVRLAQEFGLTVLRGMRIAPEHQRRGIGTRLLHLLETDFGQADCYCIPYEHLVEFYGQIGFQVLDAGSAPAHLSERLASYRTRGEGKPYILMHRPRSEPVGLREGLTPLAGDAGPA